MEFFGAQATKIKPDRRPLGLWNTLILLAAACMPGPNTLAFP